MGIKYFQLGELFFPPSALILGMVLPKWYPIESFAHFCLLTYC